jgi:ArsR family transcriptional regulator
MDALSDPARLRLLRLLERHELGVAELCDILQMPQSTVSRHLKLLLDHGLLRSRRQGTNNLYEMILDELAPPARALWLVARDQTDNWAALSHDELRLQQVLSRRESDAQAFFAGAAGEWDAIRAQLYGSRFDLAAVLPLLPADYTVADLGCGSAQLATEVARHVKTIVGVDASAEMLAAARGRLASAGVTNVDLRPGELTALPLAAAEVDAALMILALTYVADPAKALSEMARVTKPGGTAVIVDLLLHDRDDFRRQFGQKAPGFAPGWVMASLSTAGFESASTVVRPIAPDPAARGPALFVATATRGR